MEIHHLINLNGKLVKYRGFYTKPKVGFYIRVGHTPFSVKRFHEEHRLNNLSPDKIYEVYKVKNVYEVYIKNDKGFTSRLTKSLYQVVEEVTDEEINSFKETKIVLSNFDKVLKK